MTNKKSYFITGREEATNMVADTESTSVEAPLGLRNYVEGFYAIMTAKSDKEQTGENLNTLEKVTDMRNGDSKLEKSLKDIDTETVLVLEDHQEENETKEDDATNGEARNRNTEDDDDDDDVKDDYKDDNSNTTTTPGKGREKRNRQRC